jgi:hypothetical protein
MFNSFLIRVTNIAFLCTVALIIESSTISNTVNNENPKGHTKALPHSGSASP